MEINNVNHQFKSNSLKTIYDNLQETQANSVQQQLQSSLKQDYEVLTKLGSGAYGHVWKVKDKKTQQVFALKKVFSAFQNEVDAQRTYREIAYLQKLSKHENIVKLKRVIKATNEMDLYLLFEYMESDLFYAIKEDLLNDLHKKYIIYQLAKCLKYVHSAGLVHRDVKPSNILINPNCQIRLCDFGLSRTLWRYNNEEAKLTEFIATRWYRAPQVLFGSQLYNTKSDMWSVGCLIYELYARRPLLPGNDTVDQIQKVLEFKGFPNAEQKKSFRIPKIEQILELFNLQKIPLNQYFKHVKSQQVKQILIHLLEYNPEKRWTAIDLLNCSFLEQFREFQQQIQAQKQIKTGINDNQRKSVEIYRNAIYNHFVDNILDSSVDNDVQNSQNIKQKLQQLKDNKKNTLRVPSTGRKPFFRSNSQDILTEQRKPRFQNSKTSASLHLIKKNNKTMINSQRLSNRKHMSYHNPAKFASEFLQNCRESKQKTVFLQAKQKKSRPKIQFNLFKTKKTNLRNSESKEKENLQEQKSFYPKYLRSVHNSASKIPKMIQQKINQQRNLFVKSKVEETTRSSSKLTRVAAQSKEKKSPYVSQIEESLSKIHSSTFPTYLTVKNPGYGHTLNFGKNEKQSATNTNGGARKLKRKGIVN